jgi:hypothetical protein
MVGDEVFFVEALFCNDFCVVKGQALFVCVCVLQKVARTNEGEKLLERQERKLPISCSIVIG